MCEANPPSRDRRPSAPLLLFVTNSRASRGMIQVLVCRACYDVYRRLDQLRGKADRVGDRHGVSSKHSVLLDSSPTGGQRRRGAAAEAGAARLNADLAAMLRDVDARCGKLGIEAGIIWRRRLRYSLGLCLSWRYLDD